MSRDAYNLRIPSIHIEPGRSISGRAEVALYFVIGRKDIKGDAPYIVVDGGMSDNSRPSMHEAKYEVFAAEKMLSEPSQKVNVAGKFCEQGDILVKNAELPLVGVGDLLAILASGAYHISMESNYNMALKPAIVLVNNGEAKLIRRRQTLEDLTFLDLDISD